MDEFDNSGENALSRAYMHNRMEVTWLLMEAGAEMTGRMTAAVLVCAIGRHFGISVHFPLLSYNWTLSYY